MAYGQTPSQTVGPFFAYGLTPGQYGYPLPDVATADLCGEGALGERVRLVGRVFDGEGAAVPDAMLELWQPDARGRWVQPADTGGDAEPDPEFRGFGRCGTGTDPERRFVFHTVKPGAPGTGEAPHMTLAVFMRGLLTHVYTRVYFDDEAAANAADPVLQQVPADRRDTLIARRAATADGPVYRFDLYMQGPNETVFFDV
jgi:protocatechuate 3,4-dioxygenase alpha subunit